MIERIELHLASRGNHFMVEIAELYQYGFQKLGLPCRLAFDEYPNGANEPGIYPIIVAPHEYFVLYADAVLGKRRRREIAARGGILNTEQPGSRWFEIAWATARHARHVFDLNRSGVAEFARLGIPATYAPLGFAPTLVDDSGEPRGDKAIDIVFLGHGAPKRERFIAQQRALFQQFECRFLFVPVHRPSGVQSPNALFGPARNHLLRSAKILINVHSTTRRYFEWHRALCAMANRCLLLTETSEEIAPLVAGEHLVMADVDRLGELCAYYLRDDAARWALVNRAHDLLENKLPIELACQTMLNVVQREGQAKPRARLGVQFALTWKRAQSLKQTALTYLRHNRIAISLFAAVMRLRLHVRRQFRFRHYEQRRAAIIRRLETVHAAEHRADYSVTANGAAHDAARPVISVVVTLYNYARYVRECLDSVAAARVDALPGGIEIVVVDDASTDHGPQIVDEFMQTCPLPVRLVRKLSNTGLADARNIGLQVACAEYVFILDADNRIFPRCLELLYQTIQSGPLAAAFGIIACFDDASGAGLALHSAFAWDVPHLVRGGYIDAMALFNRAKVLAVGGYSTELIQFGWFGWEDYDLWLKLAAAGQEARLCPQVVAEYRVHGASMIGITNTYALNFVRQFEKKFGTLIRSVEPIERVFGWPRPVGIPAPAPLAVRDRGLT